MATFTFLLPPGSQMIEYLVNKKISEKKNCFFSKSVFSILSSFIVFGDLNVNFGIVWPSFCLLIPPRAIWWHCFAAAWLVAGS